MGRVRVAVVIGCCLLACACASDIPSEQEQELSATTFELFLARSFPVEELGYLSVQLHEDLPKTEDLELSFTLYRDLRSREPRIKVLMAEGMPISHQLRWLVPSAPGSRPVDLLARLQMLREDLALESCPDLAWIEEHWSSEWLLTTLDPSSEPVIVTHPSIVRILVKDGNRTTSIETWYDGDPAFRWAQEAADRVRGCLRDSDS